jgi:beta-hydroxyacyl-ACP dehydratase FabZ
MELDIRGVMAALPHRFPMLLVDRVEELIVDQRIVAIKAVTINEPFFAGHFPGRPIMPGVLIVEALAQAAGVLAVESLGLAGSGKLVYFMAIDGAKLRRSNRVASCASKSNSSRNAAASANSPDAQWSTENWQPKRILRR